MIVRFFKTGKSRGEAPVNYLLRLRDHNGELRPEQPEILVGNPRLTVELINGISRQYKYSSGCLAFRPEEQPSRAELLSIIDRFKAVVAPGLDPDQFNSLFVLHREPPDKKTGLSGLHVHFVLPMTLLAGKTIRGKDLTGRRWNPHPPGQRTIETMALFTSIMNHEHDWKPVSENPLRVGLDSFWRKGGKPRPGQAAELLRQALSKGIRSGQITSRDALCRYMDQELGLTITRQGNDYVSVRFPNTTRAVRLKGAMFERQTDFALLRSTMAQSHEARRLSLPEYQQATARLAQLLDQRAEDLIGSPKHKNPITITTKEKTHGSNQTRYRRHHGGHAQPGWRDALHVTKGGMERNLFPPGGEQWRHAHGGNGQESLGGSQKAVESGQHAFHANSRYAEPGGRRGIGWCIPQNYGQTLNEQIRELGMQLIECEPWSPEAAAIQIQINALVGQREQLPKGPWTGKLLR